MRCQCPSTPRTWIQNLPYSARTLNASTKISSPRWTSPSCSGYERLCILILKVVEYSKISKKFPTYNDRRKLFYEYDLFFCDKTIYPLLSKCTGKIFYERKKYLDCTYVGFLFPLMAIVCPQDTPPRRTRSIWTVSLSAPTSFKAMDQSSISIEWLISLARSRWPASHSPTRTSWRTSYRVRTISFHTYCWMMHSPHRTWDRSVWSWVKLSPYPSTPNWVRMKSQCGASNPSEWCEE